MRHAEEDSSKRLPYSSEIRKAAAYVLDTYVEASLHPAHPSSTVHNMGRKNRAHLVEMTIASRDDFVGISISTTISLLS